MGIAYFVPVATRERPVSEGGARENPSPSPQQRSNGTLPPPLSNKTKPSACTHARLSQHWQLQWTHEPARGETNSFLLTYSAKDQQRALRTQNHRGAQVASSEHGLLHKSTRETLRHRNGQLTCLHLVRLNRPFKVRGRIKRDGRDAQREKHVRLSLAALPTATYITVTETRSASRLEHTQKNK